MAASFLHNLERIDHSFNTVSNDIIVPNNMHDIYAWNTNEYFQGIQSFAYIPIIFSFIYAQCVFSIILCHCCFGKCHHMFEYGKVSNNKEKYNKNYQKLSLLFENDNKSNNDNNDNNNDNNIELTKLSKFIRWIFSLLILISLILSIIYGTSFNESIIKISNDWSNSYLEYSLLIEDGNEINNNYLPNAQLQCKEILEKESAKPIWNETLILNSSISIINKQIELFILSTESVPSWFEIDSDITPYREFIIIFPVISLVIYGLLLILNYLCYSHDYLNKKVCCCIPCSFLIIYIPFFIIIIAFIQFAISIFIADGCQNPEQNIWIATNNNNQIIKYYLFCGNNDTLINPLYIEYEKAYIELIDLNQTLQEIIFSNMSVKYDIVDQASNLYFDYTLSIGRMQRINQTLQCQTINIYKENMIQQLCNNGLNYWLIYYLMQILFIIFIVIRSWLICTENKEIDKNNGNNKNNKNNKTYGTNKLMNDGESSLMEMHDRDSVLTAKHYNHSINTNKSLIDCCDDIIINIKGNNGSNENNEYRLNKTETIYDLMEMIEEKENIAIEKQKLVYLGNALIPDMIIADNIKDGAIIYLINIDVEE